MAPFEPFGERIPLGDPAWYQGLNVPYYTESHVHWRAHLRRHVETELEPLVDEWDAAAARGDEELCRAFFQRAFLASCKAGLVASSCGQPWPAKYTDAVKPDHNDAFHELITSQEGSRAGVGVGRHSGGAVIGLPPVWNFGIPGNPELQERCAREVLAGHKTICLAVTEPTGGSDVAGLQTTAVDDNEGHFIVTGQKKWITNGIYADYFTVAVRTGGPGPGGISMLLVERGEGVETRWMLCQGVWPSGTALVTFHNVKVPKGNLIGKLNQGFKQIMHNFNHERWSLAAQATQLARTCLEESLRYARVRKTFGKFLIEHQVIQHKLGEMGRCTESLQAWLEFLTYQMCTMSKKEQDRCLGGHLALLKVHSTKLCEFCAREAMQIFGGAGYTRTGKGAKVERIYRELRPISIGGGSEEIMLNLAAAQFRFVEHPTADPRDQRIAQLEKEVKELKGRAKL